MYLIFIFDSIVMRGWRVKCEKNKNWKGYGQSKYFKIEAHEAPGEGLMAESPQNWNRCDQGTQIDLKTQHYCFKMFT